MPKTHTLGTTLEELPSLTFIMVFKKMQETEQADAFKNMRTVSKKMHTTLNHSFYWPFKKNQFPSVLCLDTKKALFLFDKKFYQTHIPSYQELLSYTNNEEQFFKMVPNFPHDLLPPLFEKGYKKCSTLEVENFANALLKKEEKIAIFLSIFEWSLINYAPLVLTKFNAVFFKFPLFLKLITKRAINKTIFPQNFFRLLNNYPFLIFDAELLIHVVKQKSFYGNNLLQILLDKGAKPYVLNSKALFTAVAYGNFSSFKTLADYDHKKALHFHKNTLLCLAAQIGHFKILSYCIEHGADIHTHEDYPLIQVCLNKKEESKNAETLQCVKLLIEKGAFVMAQQGLSLKNALCGKNTALIEFLCSQGAVLTPHSCAVILSEMTPEIEKNIKNNIKKYPFLIPDYADERCTLSLTNKLPQNISSTTPVVFECVLDASTLDSILTFDKEKKQQLHRITYIPYDE